MLAYAELAVEYRMRDKHFMERLLRITAPLQDLENREGILWFYKMMAENDFISQLAETEVLHFLVELVKTDHNLKEQSLAAEVLLTCLH